LVLDEPTAGVDPVSRRDFWEQIHHISAQGTTVLVTTHYMDEAERCHRLAFIFRGQILDTGTPEQIVERRGLHVAELEVDRPTEAARALRAAPEVDEVSHYGRVLRVATHAPTMAEDFSRSLLERAEIRVLSSRATRATVEDAFVSMVRADERKSLEEAAA
jgi:ABC-2 type transport system ATP-binding protein